LDLHAPHPVTSYGQETCSGQTAQSWNLRCVIISTSAPPGQKKTLINFVDLYERAFISPFHKDQDVPFIYLYIYGLK
jgi:hypothetical protein